MRLRNLASTDLELYEAIHCDPAMMEHLGGAWPREGMVEKLARDVASTAADETWVLVILADGDDETPAGTVAVWDHDFGHETVTEIGWMVLPAFQGRGIGKAAVRMALDRSRQTGRWSVLHAYPPVSNPASNAMCRTLGFTLIGPRAFDYHGHELRCNDWVLHLVAQGSAEPSRPGSSAGYA